MADGFVYLRVRGLCSDHNSVVIERQDMLKKNCQLLDHKSLTKVDPHNKSEHRIISLLNTE